MPAGSNITVKKDDNATDIVYTFQVPSSGDNTPAVWKSATVGSAQSHQPEIRLSAGEADNGSARRLRATYQYPQIATDTTTSLVSVVNRAVASVEWKFPKGMTATDINEFVSQFANLLDDTVIKSCIKQGFSAS
jgi:hypothetical protein